MNTADRKPSFFWQGTFILAPLLVLLGVALAFLWREHARAEEEARVRAQELAQQLAAALPRGASLELSEMEALGGGWFQYQSECLALWPGGAAYHATATNREWYQSRLPKFTNEILARNWSDIWPVQVSFDANGKLVHPTDYPRVPTPATWPNELSAEQQGVWSGARAAMAASNWTEGVNALAVLNGTNAPWALRANARFLAVMMESMTNHDASVTDFLHVARQAGGVQTESGVPLAAASFAQALRGVNELDEGLFEGLRRQVFESPSIFTPHFLEQAEARAARDARVVRALVSLRECWRAQERLRGLAAMLQKIDLKGRPLTNLWLDARDGKWMAMVKPSEWYSQTRIDGRAVTQTNLAVTARFLPLHLVGRAFGRAIATAKLVVPPYAAVQVRLEGEEVLMLRGSGSQGRDPARSLAEERGVLSLSARSASESANNPEGDRAIESLPSGPAFTVRILLADSGLLYAGRRDRTLALLFLLAGSGVVALLGLIVAHRAFHRQLRLAEMKSNFVSSVSHELRAPIASVRLMAEGLERGAVCDPKKQHEYYRFIVQECRRLSSMIENVMDFARIDQGRKQYEFEPTDLKALLKQTVEVMQAYAADREVRVTFDAPPGSAQAVDSEQNGNPLVIVDGRALQQAVVNLLDNAVKHSPAGSEVRMKVEVQDGASKSVTISVTDQGPGIPAAEHEKIFERFYRLGSELRRETPGVGIGLSIVKHIAEAHNGRVIVKSAPGQGSTFTIELPLREDTKTLNAEHP